MGNRSFLYLTRPGEQDDAFEEIAEANNTLPALWMLLLADATPSAAIDYQRVFGDAGTPNLSCDAAAGLNRLRQFVAFMERDPRLPEVEGLSRYLQASLEHLDERIAAWTQAGAPAPIISANLDELSWFEESPEEFIGSCLRSFALLWQQLDAANKLDDFQAIDSILKLDEYGLSYHHWRAWSYGFGLSGIEHPYFSYAGEAPRTGEYRDFDLDDDEEYGDLALAGGHRRYKEHGRWGVKLDSDSNDSHITLDAEWERIKRIQCDAEIDSERVWIRKEGKFGLANYAGERPGQIVLEPSLDEVGDFIEGLARARIAGGYGFIDRNAVWRIQPQWETADLFARGLAPVSRGGRFGYVDRDDRLAIELQFDAAEPFTDHDIACVRVGGHAALIRQDGSRVSSDEFDDVRWVEEFPGWVIQRGDFVGLLRESGQPWLSTEWDSIEPLPGDRLLQVMQAGKYGALDRDGRLRIACDYDELTTRFDEGHTPPDLARSDDSSSPIQLIVARNGLRGLIDDSARELVPIRFLRVDNLESQALPGVRAPQDRIFQRPDLIRVVDAESELLGVWDIVKQQLVVVCVYLQVWLCKFAGPNDYGFVALQSSALNKETQEPVLSFCLLKADGAQLFEEPFRWLCEPQYANPHFREEALAAIFAKWSSNRSVRAMSLSGRMCWLNRDGGIDAEVDRLTRAAASGQQAAVFELAVHYGNPDSIEFDPVLARQWMARAADVDPRGQARNKTVGQAMFEYADMLARGVGGEADMPAALAWMERACKATEGRNSEMTCYLGHLLGQEACGEPDHRRSVELFKQGAQRGHSVSLSNLGLAYSFGRGMPKNAAEALRCFEAAMKKGFAPAALHAARLLMAEPSQTFGSTSEQAHAKAVELLRDAVAKCEGDELGDSCEGLALFLIDGKCSPSDIHEATEILELGADQGHVGCMDLLANKVYGGWFALARNREKATYWKTRRHEFATK